MSMILCPECNQSVSDSAKTCVHCGFALKKKNKTKKVFSIIMLAVQSMAVLVSMFPIFYEFTAINTKQMHSLVRLHSSYSISYSPYTVPWRMGINWLWGYLFAILAVLLIVVCIFRLAEKENKWTKMFKPMHLAIGAHLVQVLVMFVLDSHSQENYSSDGMTQYLITGNMHFGAWIWWFLQLSVIASAVLNLLKIEKKIQ